MNAHSLHLLWRVAVPAALLAMLAGCGKSSGPAGPASAATYESTIGDGWALFAAGKYSEAKAKFAEAKAIDTARTDAYAGGGWSMFKLADLTGAAAEFIRGGTRAAPSADLFAGWAFLLNAQKDYGNSNSRADQALARDSAWSFSHGVVLRVKDLRVVKAENHFMLGNFAQSLSEVRRLNAAFVADLAVSAGIAQLAAEIERLRSAP